MEILRFPKEEADAISFAIANKDSNKEKNIFQCIADVGCLEKDSKEPKNILQCIAHDADCLEIIRAKSYFNGTYLDFVKHIARKNKQAHAEIAQLIREIRSIVEAQGDGFQRLLPHKKEKYTHEKAYHAIKSSILKDDKKIEMLESKKPIFKKTDSSILIELKTSNILDLQDILLQKLYHFPFTQISILEDLKELTALLSKYNILDEFLVKNISSQLKRLIELSTLTCLELQRFFYSIKILNKVTSQESKSTISIQYQKEILKQFIRGSDKFFAMGGDVDFLHLFTEETEENRDLFSRAIEKITIASPFIPLNYNCYTYIKLFFRDNFTLLNSWQKEIIDSVQSKEIIAHLTKKPPKFDSKRLTRIAPFLSNPSIFTIYIQNIFCYSSNEINILDVLSKLKNRMPQKAFSEEQLKVIRDLIPSEKEMIFYEYIKTRNPGLFNPRRESTLTDKGVNEDKSLNEEKSQKKRM